MPASPNPAHGRSLLEGPLRLVLIGAALAAAIGGFATLFTVLVQMSEPAPEQALRIAVEEFTSERYDLARRIASRLAFDPSEHPEREKLRLFLVGAGGALAAREEPDAGRRRIQTREAITPLRAAAVGGFPPGRSFEGHRVLGKALFETGQFEQAAEHLKKAVETDPSSTLELLPLLAESQIRAPEMPAAEALRVLQRLIDYPSLTQPRRAEAERLRSIAYRQAGQWEDARSAIERATSAGLDPHVAELELAQIELREAEELAVRFRIQDQTGPPVPAIARLLESAMDRLYELARVAPLEVAISARYLGGIAFRKAGRTEDALGLFYEVRESRGFPAEAIAAGLEELEILAESGEDGDLLRTALGTLQAIGDPRTFDPRWMSLAEYQRRLVAVSSELRRAGRYRAAIELAAMLPPVVPPAETLALEASGWSDWADAILASNVQPNGLPSEASVTTARSYYRKAGDALATAAGLRFDEADYLALLWRAIEAYERGRSYHRALSLAEDYLHYAHRPQLPRGLLAQGRALLALGRYREALLPLEACILEHPNDSLRYEGRLIAARTYGELGNVAKARELLEANLYDGLLAPSSPVWRESLFTLGELLYQEARTNHLALTAPDQTIADVGERFRHNQEIILETIRRLEEADARYGELRKSRRARYLAAQAHQMAAHWPALQAAKPETLASARRQLNQERVQHLEAAHEAFRSDRDRQKSVQERGELTDWEQLMLRSCYLSEGETLFDLARYEEAAEAYRGTTHRFLNEPSALEAMVQQARCFEMLDRREDARRIYRQAVQILDRIPEELDPTFAQTTRYDRAGWRNLLGWLQTT